MRLMNTTNSSLFSYSANLKLNEFENSVKQIFPGVNNIAINSRTFKTYDDCINSAKCLFNDIVQNANLEQKQFMVSSEFNPIHSGVNNAYSRDWEQQELARFWLHEKQELTELKGQNSSIRAVGQARIFMI